MDDKDIVKFKVIFTHMLRSDSSMDDKDMTSTASSVR